MKQLVTTFVFSLLIFISPDMVAYAQQNVEQTPSQVDSIPLLETNQQDAQEAVSQLQEIQRSLQLKITEREELATELNSLEAPASEAQQEELEKLDADIELLNKTFEQIAIGDIDLTAFGVEQKNFDWREELILVVQPLIENLKGLTEKPRKIESLKRVIEDKAIAKESSQQALQAVRELQTVAELDSVTQKLQDVESEWSSRLNDINREIQLAEYQLNSLEGGDVRWADVAKQGAYDFIHGRGLTLLLVVLSALAVWLLMKGVLVIIRKRTVDSHDRQVKVQYRLASYAYRLLTIILISIAIMMVLYIRGDLLLLAIMLIVFIGVALALKNLLPKYIAEGRLLLNIGGVRERERIVRDGVPWQVRAINMHSRFTNPEIRGALRIPISQMHEMVSRPSFEEEPWFPSSEGDWMLKDGSELINVVVQTPDTVQLRDLNNISHYMSTQDYYHSGYENISRADVFRVTSSFGIDYGTQSYDMDGIEKAFAEGIKKEFSKASFAGYVQSVSVEFHSAGDSSLNYLMLARFKSDAAGDYNHIKRKINRACVKVCTENEWPIPFPQMSVHLEGAGAHDSTQLQGEN